MQLDPLLENCIFHISPMYEFSQSLGRINSMHLENRLRDVETDRCNRLHG
jgi:hypothetical protein